MNEILQKTILKILISKPSGEASLFDIQHDDLLLEYWLQKENSVMDERCNEFIRFFDSFDKGMYRDDLIRQLNFLLQQNKIIRYSDNFRLTQEGYICSDTLLRQAWHYLVSSLKKDPLPILLSVVALVVSIIALK